MEQTEKLLIILLGEGNFSFANLLAQRLLLLNNDLDLDNNNKYDLIATDYRWNEEEEEENLGYSYNDLLNDPMIQQNISKLVKNGIPVWLDVDATKLEKHRKLNNYLRTNGPYREVHYIFNFPHVHNVKMKINLNRDLLRDCFISLEKITAQFYNYRSLIHISLCHGQSGLVQLEQLQSRSWNDSWQLTEMAASGNFVLTNIQPFRMDSFVSTLIERHNSKSKLNEFERNLFRHNRKTFSSKVFGNFESSKEILPEDQIVTDLNNFQPFGYRLQNKPFNKITNEDNDDELRNGFRGGNIFTLKHREDIVQKVESSFDQDKINSRNSIYNSIVDEFINDIRNLLIENECRISIDLIEKEIIITKIYEDPITLIEVIAQYLIDDQQQQQDTPTIICQKSENSLRKTLCFIGNHNVPFGSFSTPTISDSSELILQLNIDICLKIRWNIVDIRLLSSSYLTIMNDPDVFDDSRRILSSNKLYPRMYVRDISFWFDRTSNSNQNNFETDTFMTLVQTVLGSSLVNISLIDCYIKSSTLVSYCYRVTIQSLDLALNRFKVNRIMEILAENLTEKIVGIRMR